MRRSGSFPVQAGARATTGDYTKADVHRFGFIRRARDLGFSIEQIRNLLRLWADKRRSSRNVKALALEHIAELQTKVAALQEMSAILQQLADACDGNDRPNCPIIRSLASDGDQHAS